MAGKKYTRVRSHIRRPRKESKPRGGGSPIQRIVEAEAENTIKGKQRKIS